MFSYGVPPWDGNTEPKSVIQFIELIVALRTKVVFFWVNQKFQGVFVRKLEKLKAVVEMMCLLVCRKTRERISFCPAVFIKRNKHPSLETSF